jgi:hypothetical protein
MLKRLLILLVFMTTLAVPASAFASAPAAHHQAMVSVIHGIPGPDGLPVDVSVDGACTLKGFTFKEIAGPLPLDKATYDIAISLANAGEPCGNKPVIGPVSLTFEGGKNYTVIAHLTAAGAPTASVYENNLSPLAKGKARATVRHNAAAPAVDVKLQRKLAFWEHDAIAASSDAQPASWGYDGRHQWRVVIKDLSNPEEEEAELKAGLWRASVFAAGTRDRVLGPTRIRFKALKATFVYAVGSLEDGTLDVIKQEFDVPLGASVSVIHGINGKDLGAPEELPVDVSVNGACILTGFAFKDIEGPLTLAEGTYNIAISLADEANPCKGPVAIGPADIPFEAGENATVIAYLNGAGNPTAHKYVNDLSRIRFWKARVAVRHNAVAPTVDVSLKRFLRSRYAVVFPDLSNSDESVRNVVIGRWLAQIFPAGASTPVYGPTELYLWPRTHYGVYAVGTFPETFSLIVHPVH